MTRPQSEAEYLARSSRRRWPAAVRPPGPPARRARRRRACSAPPPLASCGCSDGRAAARPPASATGTVTFGSNQSDAVPKAGLRRRSWTRSTTANTELTSRSTRSTTTRSRRTSTPTCRAARTTSSPGSPATGCGSSPHKGLVGDISDVWQNLNGMLRRPQDRVHRRRRQAVLRAVRPTTRGRSSTARASSRRTATRSPKTLDELVDPRRKQMQEDGLVPIAFARQGRLARDGHVRPAQHADQRLRVPRRPDGRQGGVELRQGQEGLRHLEPACCPSTSRTRSGRTWQEAAQSLQQKKAGHVPARHVRRPAVHQGRRAGRPGLLRLPGDRLRHRRRRDRGPDRRLHDGQASPKNEAGGEEAARATSARPRPRTSYVKADPTRHRGQHRRRHQRATPRCRRRRSSSSVGAKNIAQFLDRDTRPDFASTVMIPALQQLHQEPERHRRADQEHREARRSRSSPPDGR